MIPIARVCRVGRMGAALVAVVAIMTVFGGVAPAVAGMSAPAETFVGKAGDCGTGYPAGSRVVTAQWLVGLGLPDNGGPNTNPGDPTDNPNKTDNHYGLLLSKDVPPPDCSAAGARIVSLPSNLTVDWDTELGFDYRNGSYCSGGAPRFNVQAKLGSDPVTFHFVGGCGNATPTPAPQDPTRWSRVRFNLTNPSQAFPTIPVGARIISIGIILDEDGLAVIDNIHIAGQTLTNQNKIIVEESPE